MTGLFLLLCLCALGAAAFAFARVWAGVAVVAGLPVAFVALFFALGTYLNGSEDTDQSGMSAMLTAAILLPFVAGVLITTVLGWLAGVGFRVVKSASKYTQETFE